MQAVYIEPFPVDIMQLKTIHWSLKAKKNFNSLNPDKNIDELKYAFIDIAPTTCLINDSGLEYINQTVLVKDG